MSSIFHIISEEFSTDIEAISDLISLVSNGGGSSKSRIASINSATLLLAATFEEFVREMARQYARELVARTTDVSDVPRKLTATAWKRALQDMSKAKIDNEGEASSLLHIATEARSEFDAICKFLEGDLSQNIYKHVAHNENNMRPDQMNAIFNVSGVKNICQKISEVDSLQTYLGEDDAGRTNSKFRQALNNLMDRRNSIAHSLNPASSVGVGQFREDLHLLKAVGIAMATYLPLQLPAITQAEEAAVDGV